jgi:hypothetical protein
MARSAMRNVAVISGRLDRRHEAEGDGDPVPAIDRDHCSGQIDEFLIGERRLRDRINIVGHVVVR